MPKGGRKGAHIGQARQYTSPEEIEAQLQAEKQKAREEEEQKEGGDGAAGDPKKEKKSLDSDESEDEEDNYQQRRRRAQRHREPQPGGTDNQKGHITGSRRANRAFEERKRRD
nr:28 kDa heat- and acid-stable phosphoprotein-like [Symphalangus syndactylus]